MLVILAALLATAAHAATPPDFTGSWQLNAAKSTNLGPMASMGYSSVITQTPDVMTVRSTTTMMGQTQTQETRYALHGEPTANANYMGDAAQTVSRWDEGRVVTTWISPGAVAGTTTVRTEIRALSVDGKVMTLEMKSNDKPSRIFVFERK
jgi:hypothetical protein